MTSVRLGPPAILAMAVVICSAGSHAQQPPAPGNPIVFVEVEVVESGAPVAGLEPRQFEVSIDGSRRQVVSVQLVRNSAAGSSSPTDVPGRYRVGFELSPADRDGSVHQLSVRVAASREMTVRAPAQVRIAKPATAPATSPAAMPATTPAPSDVAAWEHLWGGAVTAPSAAVAPAARPAPVEVPATPAERPAPSAAGSALDDLYTKYSSGDAGVVLRELRTTDDFERVRPELASTLARWRTDFSPRRATFAMEVALTAFARRWPNPQLYLGAARDIVTSRPDPPGTRPDDDAFELRFHRTAVALLSALDGAQAVDAYLTSIQNRIALTSTPKGAMLSDATLVLSQARARETQTLRPPLTVGSRGNEPRAWIVSDGGMRRQLEEISKQLELAAADEDTRDEATVRRAFVLYRLGAHQEAFGLLGPSAPTDEVVDYWRALILGRVLVALGRQREAIDSFERATALAPDAQTPAVALTTIFLKAGDREQALGWAERARTTTENRGDSWPVYWSGDARFLARRLADLRDSQQ